MQEKSLNEIKEKYGPIVANVAKRDYEKKSEEELKQDRIRDLGERFGSISEQIGMDGGLRRYDFNTENKLIIVY